MVSKEPVRIPVLNSKSSNGTFAKKKKKILKCGRNDIHNIQNVFKNVIKIFLVLFSSVAMEPEPNILIKAPEPQNNFGSTGCGSTTPTIIKVFFPVYFDRMEFQI